jgi:TRAP-type C4-dicarboxylate transport system permease small subunit
MKKGRMFSGIKLVFEKIFIVFARSSEWILLLLAVIIFYDVLMRYLFVRPTIWALEISEYLLVYICFAGVTEAQRLKAHIKMRFFFSKFPEVIQLYLNLIFTLFTILFSFIIFLGAYDLTVSAFRLDSMSNTLLETPLFIPYALVPIGMGFLTLQSLFDMVESIGEVIGFHRSRRVR